MSDPAHVIVVGGPAGTGKSTVAQLLADKFGGTFIEGDDLHPKENIDKMSAGIPLTDDDRWNWLSKVSTQSAKAAIDSKSRISLVSCSVLKKKYRNYIRDNSTYEPYQIKFIFVFLYATFEELQDRISKRKNHFMKGNMLQSQYKEMEIPKDENTIYNLGDELRCDTTMKTPEMIYIEIYKDLKEYIPRI